MSSIAYIQYHQYRAIFRNDTTRYEHDTPRYTSPAVVHGVCTKQCQRYYFSTKASSYPGEGLKNIVSKSAVRFSKLEKFFLVGSIAESPTLSPL